MEIDDNNGNVTLHKGTVIGYRQTFISRQNIASVRIATGLFFADIIIESMDGAEKSNSSTLYRKDNQPKWCMIIVYIVKIQ